MEKKTLKALVEQNDNLRIKLQDTSERKKTFKRSMSIDCLRVIGILLVIMAHSFLKYEENSILMQLRSFDVVLMVFISGLSFARSNKNDSGKEYFRYLIKRFKRLVLPCWGFITLYLVYSALLSIWFPIDYLDFKTVIMSYTLISDFGYVWIIRVFFSLAIIAPFIHKAISAINAKPMIVTIPFFAFVFNSILCFVSRNLTGLASVMTVTVLPVLGYGLVYWYAIIYDKLTFGLKTMIFCLFFAFTIGFSFLNGFLPIDYKKPPSSLYISYGVTASIFLYELVSYIFRNNNKEIRIVSWLSKNSFTIYFSHLFIVLFFDQTFWLKKYWFAEYIIIVFGAIIVTLIYLYLKKRVKYYLDTRMFKTTLNNY